jgi:hypothetical protein
MMIVVEDSGPISSILMLRISCQQACIQSITVKRDCDSIFTAQEYCVH